MNSSAQTDGTEVQSYSVDKTHSSVGFAVRHLGISKVRGTFADFDANVQFDPADLSTLSVTATIQVESVDTGVERRDNDLRSDNFFSAAQYPSMTFESLRVENLDGNAFELVGNLTIMETTKEVVLKGEFYGVAGDKAGFSAETRILRKEFGLMWDRTTEAGSIVVSNEVDINLDLEQNNRHCGGILVNQ
jgi:polyisoprenoid-binding protein YceI